MVKAVSIALIVGGVVLLYFGGQSFHSFANDMSRVFTGAPTDKTIWLIAGGVVTTVAGLIGLASSSGSSRKR
jgi:NO-binding membrane sensor protein with MHYT domain